MIRKTIASLMILLLTSMTLAASATSPCSVYQGGQETAGAAPLVDYEEAKRRLDLFMDRIEELRSHIDRSQFDLDALLEKLDFDADNIIKFVKEEIYFEQYPGLLRGAQGTLMSRAGNALDQSVLLATLLRSAGYEARIHRGVLPPAQIAVLGNELFQERTAAPPVGNRVEIARILSELRSPDARLSALVPDNLDKAVDITPLGPTDMLASVEAETDFVLKKLREGGINITEPDNGRAFAEEAKDYYWVEHRLGRSNPWNALHPVFQETIELAPDIRETYTGPIPEDLQHRFRFEVSIEQKLGSKLLIHNIVKPWERPVANLIGTPLEYRNFPDGLAKADKGTFDDSWMENTVGFSPLLNRQLPAGGRFFDLNGIPLDPIAAGAPAAGLFRTIAEQFGLATEAVVGSEFPDDQLALTGLRMDFTFIAPGGRSTTHRRTIVDRIDPATRSSESPRISADPTVPEVVRRIAEVKTFMVAPCALPDAYVIDRQLTWLIEAKSLIGMALQEFLSEDEPETSGKSTELPYWMGHFVVYPLFEALLGNTSGQNRYRSSPALVVHSEDLAVTDPIQRMDIVQSQWRSYVRAQGGSLSLAVPDLVRSGVWETLAERVALSGQNTDGSGERRSAIEILRLAREADVAFSVVNSDQTGQLDRLEISDLAKANIRRDLDLGFLAIVPEGASSSSGMAWWRVNANTGETQGMLEDGTGGIIANYITHLTADIKNATLTTRFVQSFTFFLLCVGNLFLVDAARNVVSHPARMTTFGDRGMGGVPLSHKSCAKAAGVVLFVGPEGPLISVILGILMSNFTYVVGDGDLVPIPRP